MMSWIGVSFIQFSRFINRAEFKSSFMRVPIASFAFMFMLLVRYVRKLGTKYWLKHALFSACISFSLVCVFHIHSTDNDCIVFEHECWSVVLSLTWWALLAQWAPSTQGASLKNKHHWHKSMIDMAIISNTTSIINMMNIVITNSVKNSKNFHQEWALLAGWGLNHHLLPSAKSCKLFWELNFIIVAYLPQALHPINFFVCGGHPPTIIVSPLFWRQLLKELLLQKPYYFTNLLTFLLKMQSLM